MRDQRCLGMGFASSRRRDVEREEKDRAHYVGGGRGAKTGRPAWGPETLYPKQPTGPEQARSGKKSNGGATSKPEIGGSLAGVHRGGTYRSHTRVSLFAPLYSEGT